MEPGKLTQLDKVIIGVGCVLLGFTAIAHYIPGSFMPAWEILAGITTSTWTLLLGKKMDKDA